MAAKKFDTIADELNEELNGRIEFADYDDRPAIIWSDPGEHPNRRYNPNNVAVVYTDEHHTKARIKTELLSYWFVIEIE